MYQIQVDGLTVSFTDLDSAARQYLRFIDCNCIENIHTTKDITSRAMELAYGAKS